MVVIDHTDLRGSAAATGPRTMIVERRTTSRGVMPPLHAHPEDARYEVLEGELTFFVGGEIVRATSGQVLVVRAGVPHTFRVEVPQARWLVATRVASPARFEDFGLALARPVEDWPSAEELAAVEAMAASNGIEILGPPGRLPESV
jgi:mannose-6-phosphate isomerase-like protein (cupin superfamily)